MTAVKRTWARNTRGLEASATQRTEATRRRVDDAIATMLRDPFRRINFNTVAAEAAVTKAHLHAEPSLRERIDALRRNQEETRRRLIPVPNRTDASNRFLVAAKDRRIRRPP